jgi:hypothetical protein
MPSAYWPKGAFRNRPLRKITTFNEARARLNEHAKRYSVASPLRWRTLRGCCFDYEA